jgi:hypothetical protein
MRYNNPEIKYTISGKRYYKRKIYPQIPFSDTDIYVITTIGDRLDSLAYTYYRNAELWWVISIANNNSTNGSIFPQPGVQLRIPTNINYVLDLFELENEI